MSAPHHASHLPGGRIDARSPRLRLSRKAAHRGLHSLAVVRWLQPLRSSAPRSRRSVRASHIGFALPPASHLKRTRIGNRQGKKPPPLARAARQVAASSVVLVPACAASSVSDLLASVPPLREHLTRHPLAAIGTYHFCFTKRWFPSCHEAKTPCKIHSPFKPYFTRWRQKSLLAPFPFWLHPQAVE